MVLVVLSGRAFVLSDVEPYCDAILQAWFPGTEAGRAIADILYGIAQPEGKLTISFPYTEGQLPLYYNGFRTGRPQKEEALTGGEINEVDEIYVSHYIDCQNKPLYPFGYGLSYTDYAYRDLKLSSEYMYPGGTIQASVKVKNTGERVGREIVQLYLCDPVGSVVRPVKELKAYRLLELQPGEEQECIFTISEEDLKFWDNEEKKVLEPGRFIVMAGPDSERLLKSEFVYKLKKER